MKGRDPETGEAIERSQRACLMERFHIGHGTLELESGERAAHLSLAVRIGVLVGGDFCTVLTTENIERDLELSPVVSGLFPTAPIAALLEVFATWSVAKSGQITLAVTSVIEAQAVTMTVAFLPSNAVTLPL